MNQRQIYTIVASVAESKELSKLDDCLLKYRELLAERSPTAKLWLQYIEYVETLKVFIRAERTGDWNLHLIAVTQMLNLFTGHINYATSASLKKDSIQSAEAIASGQEYGRTLQLNRS